jgi:hypothetical protein
MPPVPGLVKILGKYIIFVVTYRTGVVYGNDGGDALPN